MDARKFVDLCYKEKEKVLNVYFDSGSETLVGKKLKYLIDKGIDKNILYDLVDMVMVESYYTLLLGIDGATSLGDEQITYKLYDEDGTLLNESGEIEQYAYELFIDNQ